MVRDCHSSVSGCLALLIAVSALIVSSCAPHRIAPSSDDLLERFDLTNADLNQLVRYGATLDEVVVRYGPPISIREEANGRSYAVFEMAANHPEFLPPVSGRVGFTAEFENGRIISWCEIWREIVQR